MLTAPWALLALISVPIVFGIYFFRTRSRRREVSSLFLWVDQSQAKQGGRRIQRLQLPLLIFLELLALILLAIAAARPMLRIESMGRPTAIILDTSFSMQAEAESESDGKKETVQQRALHDLNRMLDFQVGYPVQFIFAGTKPQVVAGRAKNAAEARDILKSWTCESPTAAIDAAIALASNISTSGTKILVVTDHAPDTEVAEGRLLWKTYGKSLPNLAIIHASRVYQGEKDRMLLEIANLSDTPKQLRLSVIEPKRNEMIHRIDQELAPTETYRTRAGIKDGVGSIEVRLGDDALAIDNRLTLLPPSRRPVRVKLGDLPPELVSKIRRAVETSGIAMIVDDRPDLAFGPIPEAERTTPCWTVRFVKEPDAAKQKAFIGPFVLDRQHPISTGLSLDGVVWSGAEEPAMDGIALISAGSVPLLTEQFRRGGVRILNIQLNDRLSTLTGSPSWPILIWNILKYRSGETVGVATANVKLGAEVLFIGAEGDDAVEVTAPDGVRKSMPISNGSASLPADQVGVYPLKAASGEYSFAVGALSAVESDLRKGSTDTFGNWLDEETLRTDYESIVWILLLSTLALLTAHHWFVSRQSNV